MSQTTDSFKPVTPYESIVDNGSPLGAQPFRPLVYLFEHRVLPQMAFGDHPEIGRAFQTRQTLGADFFHVWSKSAVLCESTGMWPEGTTDDLDAYAAYASRLWDLMACVPTFEEDYTVWTVRTPPPVAPGETFFVAFLSPTSSTAHASVPHRPKRYYTLELSLNSQTVLCEWTAGGSHLNHGSQPRHTSHGFTELVLHHARSSADLRNSEA